MKISKRYLGEEFLLSNDSLNHVIGGRRKPENKPPKTLEEILEEEMNKTHPCDNA